MKNKILTGVLTVMLLLTAIGWVMSTNANQELREVAQEQKDDINKKSTEIANLKNVIVKKDDDLKSNIVVIEEKDSQINKLKQDGKKLEEDNKRIMSRKDKLEKDVTTLKNNYSKSQAELKAEKAKKKVVRQSSEVKEKQVVVSRGTPYASKEEVQKKKDSYKSKATGRQITVNATAYIAMCDTGCTGITATGIDVRNTITYKGLRVIAVDPSVIPLHTVVNVSVGGQSFTAIAVDTGGAIKGNKIDILVGSQSQAINFGRQKATITFLK